MNIYTLEVFIISGPVEAKFVMKNPVMSRLLGNAPRKNVEQMALGMREKVRSLQYFVGQSQWQTEPVIVIHQGLIGETLGQEDGVMLIDESSSIKQGTKSVGVAAQYCGSVGKIKRIVQIGNDGVSMLPAPAKTFAGCSRVRFGIR